MEATKPVEQENPKDEVDNKGVPLVNRLKEMERKLQEKYDKELEATRKELADLKAGMENGREKEEIPEKSLDELSKAELMKLVANPKGYIASVMNENSMARELQMVRPWLGQQDGYNPAEDNDRLIAIENEYHLADPSPMERVKNAWDILKKEKLVKKYSSMTEDQLRQEAVKRASTESGGKSTSKKTEMNRADLIKKLAQAEQKGDIDASIYYMDKLEDVRE